PRLAQFGEQASQGLQLLFLKFGREDESQSDELGVEYSSKIGYDAAQMADFFQTLQREQEKSGTPAIPDFLSTHPNPADRYNRVHQLADEWKAKNGNPKNLAVGRDSYLKLIDGLTYGEDPRQGFVENNTFYHPDLKFRFPVPAGWKTQNSPQQFQMADPAGKALMMLALAPGATLEEAAQALVKQFSLQPISEPSRAAVNGFPALSFVADQVPQQQQGQPQQQAQGQQAPGVRALVQLLQDGKTIYLLLGASSAVDFAGYQPTFSSVMDNFQRLTDPDKLNRQPEHVRVKTLKLRSTLAQALRTLGVPEKRHEEMAILNGMQLNEQVNAGSLIKLVGK
ncbi:M48 family metalloprotease, partial [uncultured Hymenobacter sp.]|uniref:M48 family metalloprotease n=1 Tax=uncultured Hymenobacter sp. TaxID=170016 RepID=UPI0035CA8BF4